MRKILSITHASFSLFWLLFTLLVGLLTALASYLLEPISDFLHKEKGYKQYQHLEWITNATLQLQRLGHEAKGLGTWSKCTESIPTTEPDELLGCLEITDPGHPVLYPPSKEADPASPAHESLVPLEVVASDELSSTQGSSGSMLTSLFNDGTPSTHQERRSQP
ncbi:hypothetical protein GGS20DRAFT_587633 [Poronia punctata]|nr:hypothetical protein GGS20DRAFT_587633 [Poronia punctata]